MLAIISALIVGMVIGALLHDFYCIWFSGTVWYLESKKEQ